MRHLIGSVLFVSILPSCIQVEGSGISAEEVRDVGPFSALAATTMIDTFVAPGAEPSVVVRCDDNLLEHIETEVQGGELVIGTSSKVGIDPHAVCEVDIVAPALEALRGTGSGALDAQGDWSALTEVQSSGSGPVTVEGGLPALAFVNGSGSGRLRVFGIEGDGVAIDCSGSGGIEAFGVARFADVTNAGSGGIDAIDLMVVDAEIRNSGSGEVSLSATGDVTVDLSGSGDVVLDGGARVQADDSGSGSVVSR
jgi:hypothetical protein